MVNPFKAIGHALNPKNAGKDIKKAFVHPVKSFKQVATAPVRAASGMPGLPGMPGKKKKKGLFDAVAGRVNNGNTGVNGGAEY